MQKKRGELFGSMPKIRSTRGNIKLSSNNYVLVTVLFNICFNPLGILLCPSFFVSVFLEE